MKNENVSGKKREKMLKSFLFFYSVVNSPRSPFGRCVYDKRILQSGKGADRFLYVGKESRKMPAVRKGMVYLYGKGQKKAPVLFIIFSPIEQGRCPFFPRSCARYEGEK